MTEFLSREAIRDADDIETEVVHIPQWGGSVRVRGLSGVERRRFERSIRVQAKGGRRRRGAAATDVKDDLRERLVIWCCVDEQGERLFTNADLEWIGEKSSAAIEQIVDVAMRLSWLGDDDMDELAEEMADDPFGDSSSP